MCLEDPMYHGWKQDIAVQWRDNFLENCDGKDDDCVCKYELTDDKISNTSYSKS